MDCSPPGSSVHGGSLGKNTGVGSHFLLQGFFPTQRLNPGLPHCRQTLHPLSQQGSPKYGGISFSRGSSQPRDQAQVSCTADRLYPLSYKASHCQEGPLKYNKNEVCGHICILLFSKNRMNVIVSHFVTPP